MHVQVPWQAIEEAFWNIVEEGEQDVEVLYGADLDSTIFGSAFPTRNGRMSESEYADAPWNLNNIPRLPGASPVHMLTTQVPVSFPIRVSLLTPQRTLSFVTLRMSGPPPALLKM